MNSTQFIYWLKGFLASMGEGGATKEQLEVINEQLELVIITKPTGPVYRGPIGETGTPKDSKPTVKPIADLIKRKAKETERVHRSKPTDPVSQLDDAPKLTAEEVAQIKKTFDEAMSKMPKPTVRGGFIPSCHHCGPRFGK